MTGTGESRRGEAAMFAKKFQLNSQTLEVIEELGKHMPGGFFI